jgi:hypothetical protein
MAYLSILQVSQTEHRIIECKYSDICLENDNTAKGDPFRWPRHTPYAQMLELTCRQAAAARSV